jgi:hypothetical protein
VSSPDGDRAAIPSPPEPIGAFVNDNVTVCTAAFVSEDKQAGYQKCLDAKLNYLQSNVFRYHDTFPHPETGCDQISFGVSGADLEASLETIRLLGEHVIPKIDTEPLHSTTRYRQAAAKS